MTSPEWAAARDPAAYDDRWAGVEHPHGEADLVASYAPRSVLDAGCGTGRVAIELARRGIHAVGVDVDAGMIGIARAKAPDLEWVVADLADLRRPERFDVVVLAGNVVAFAARPAAVVTACAHHVAPGGRLIAGWEIDRPGRPHPDEVRDWCAAAGLRQEHTWSSWDRQPWRKHTYAVSVAVRRAGGS